MKRPVVRRCRATRTDRSRGRRTFGPCVLMTAAALVATACGSGSKAGTSAPASASGRGVATTQSGPGYTSATAPSGTRLSGGTVTFTEDPGSAPNYIFPMVSPEACSGANIAQLETVLYRPLYWAGNDGSPTIDYSYSIARKPIFSDDDRTVTITMKPWKWSDGSPVTSRDVEFFLHMYAANPSSNYCDFSPGYIPQNILSMATPNQHTLVLHLRKSYDPEWFLYNQLSQLFPLPLAWDRTSLSQPAPTNPNATLPDDTKAGAEKVYTFLSTQSQKVASWASSPIWKIVDGPFRLQSYTSSGKVTFVANPKYSGLPRPTISKFVELPFTSDTAEFNEESAGGPGAVTIGTVPAQDVPQISALERKGYLYNRASTYSIDYLPLNFHNPAIGPVFSQLYFRQALQHLVDQNGWIHAFLNGAAVPTYGPIPPGVPSPLVSVNLSANPYPFSVSAATALLKDHGWKVMPGGRTTCVKAGTGAGECGAGIAQGHDIAFTIDYVSGVPAVQSEMTDLQAQARKAGIAITLTSHTFGSVVSAGVACTPKASDCGWQVENPGLGSVYAPDYLPTGEGLFAKGSPGNRGSYYTPKAQKLIDQTIYGPLSGEKTALTAYANYIAQQVPVLFIPTSTGTYGGVGTVVSDRLGGYAANAFSYRDPEDWYLTK